MPTMRKPADTATEKLVSANELGEAWGCHATTAARLLREAGFEPITFTRARNGLKRWRKSDVELFLRKKSGK